MKPEELSRLPGYEIRAQVFMEGVRKIEKKALEERGSILMVAVKDEFEADKGLSDSERKKREDFYKELGMDWIPPELRGETVIRVSASCDLYEPLKKFVGQTLDLAQRQGGRIDGKSAPLSDEEIEDLIADAERKTWFLTSLLFTFDENLPGSI